VDVAARHEHGFLLRYFGLWRIFVVNPKGNRNLSRARRSCELARYAGHLLLDQALRWSWVCAASRRSMLYRSTRCGVCGFLGPSGAGKSTFFYWPLAFRPLIPGAGRRLPGDQEDRGFFAIPAYPGATSMDRLGRVAVARLVRRPGRRSLHSQNKNAS